MPRSNRVVPRSRLRCRLNGAVGLRQIEGRQIERRQIGVLLTAVLLAWACQLLVPIAARGQDEPRAQNERRPNIVLIMADDVGVEGLGCYGGLSYKTPALDQLASDGLRFTHAYAQPLCTNTRLQLMTGLYNHRNWLSFGILDPKAKTIGHYMSEAGYKTCIAGKWQLQSYDPPDYPGAATRRGTGMRVENAGFDEYCLWHTGHTEQKGSRYADPVILRNGDFRDDLQGRYGPDVSVEFIKDFVRRHREQPFFVYYAMALPHWPMAPTPDSPEWTDPAQRSTEDVRFIKDMIEYMDKCVGRIVKQIDALGLKENTLLIFYSDNGTHRKVTSLTRDGSIDGGKGLTTDAGTHVPLIVRWPAKTKPAVVDDLVDSTDFLPTLLDATRKSRPADLETDGISFYPRLVGEPGRRRSWVYCYFDPRPGWDKDKFTRLIFARDKRFKLYDDGRLYDVPQDALEQKPIRADDETGASRSARQRLAAVLKSLAKP